MKEATHAEDPTFYARALEAPVRKSGAATELAGPNSPQAASRQGTSTGKNLTALAASGTGCLSVELEPTARSLLAAHQFEMNAFERFQ